MKHHPELSSAYSAQGPGQRRLKLIKPLLRESNTFLWIIEHFLPVLTMGCTLVAVSQVANPVSVLYPLNPIPDAMHAAS